MHRRRRSFLLAFALVLLLLAAIRYAKAQAPTGCPAGPVACAVLATSN